MSDDPDLNPQPLPPESAAGVPQEPGNAGAPPRPGDAAPQQPGPGGTQPGPAAPQQPGPSVPQQPGYGAQHPGYGAQQHGYGVEQAGYGAQQSGYGAPQQPGYGAPGYGASARPGYNTMAIVGFILAFFVNIVGIILGFVALSQIKRTGEQGHGLAVAAIVIGFAEIALGILLAIVFSIIFGAAMSHYRTY